MEHRRVRHTHCEKAIRIIQEDLGIIVKRNGRKDYFTSSCSPWFLLEQSISIGTKSTAEQILMALSHELGHCLSVRTGSPSSIGTTLIDRLGAPLNAKQKKSILKEEARAWTLGYRFLRQHSFPITEWMLYMRKLLYGSHIKRLNYR